MAEEVKTPTVEATVTVVTPETGTPEGEKKPEPEVKVPEAKVDETKTDGKPEEKTEEPKNVEGLKSALEKERADRKKAEKEHKEAISKLTELQKQVQAIEEEKAVEKGEFKKLAEDRKTSLIEAETRLRAEQERYVTEKAAYDERLKSKDATMHDFIDSQIQDFPDKAKGLVDTREELTDADARMRQYKKALPFVKEFLGTPATPGIGPSPVTTTSNVPTKDDLYSRMKSNPIYQR